MGTPAVRMGWMLQLDAWRRSLPPAALSPVNQRAADPFERLFVQEYAKVVAIAYRVLADRTAAEDVAQEVFLKFHRDRKSTRLNSSHVSISYAVFCLKKKN